MVELGEFAKHYDEFKALNVRIIGVTVDPVSQARSTKEKLHLPFLLLSDSHRAAMKLYGTRSPSKYHAEGGPYDAATLVLIDRTGAIRWIYQNQNYKIRAPVSLDLSEARKRQ